MSTADITEMLNSRGIQLKSKEVQLEKTKIQNIKVPYMS